MSYPHFDLVERAYEELVNEGKIQQRSDQGQVEEDKGLLTRRSGYYSNMERDPTIGILEKNSGNNSQGYSTDILIKSDGTFWDIATDSDGWARPINGGPSDDQRLIPKWRQPTAELAGLTSGPAPEPPPANDDKLDQLITMNIVLMKKVDDLANAEQETLNAVLHLEERLNQVVEDMENTLTRLLPAITCNYKPSGEGVQ